MVDPDGNAATPYQEIFSDSAVVEAYSDLYSSDSRDAGLWIHQRRHLRSLVHDFTSGRGRVAALDFACGFGRVAGSYVDLVGTVDGVDSSAEMIAVAEQTGDGVRYRTNLSHQMVKDGESYDLVTAFRFFLNTEPELRQSILDDLFALLRERTGELIVHNHGNRLSLRTPLLRLRRRGAAQATSTDFQNTLGHREFVRLLENAGFEVRSRVGFGILPNRCYRGRLGKLARRLDPGTAHRGILRHICIESVYVAGVAQR